MSRPFSTFHVKHIVDVEKSGVRTGFDGSGQFGGSILYSPGLVSRETSTHRILLGHTPSLPRATAKATRAPARAPSSRPLPPPARLFHVKRAI